MSAETSPLVADDLATRTVYSTDNSIYQVTPAAVAQPRSADEVVKLVAEESARRPRRPIVARGGGTGTNGQSLTDGVIVDLKRHLNRIVAIDPERRQAEVEPGLVTGELNAALASHGLFWAPHTSTLNRATVGGMISTDAAGKGSLVHGRAHRHVLALDVVLDDGTPWRAEPMPVVEAEARSRVDDRIGQLWRDLLALPLSEGVDLGLPSLARGFSGYGIDRFRRDGLVDPLALLCGAEGTLGLVTKATLGLTPLPREVVLVVAGYETFAEALEDAVDLAATGPTAIETFDETTLDRGRASPAWPALGELVSEGVGSVLLLEYTVWPDPDREGGGRPTGVNGGLDVDSIVAKVRATGRSRSVEAARDRRQQALAWKVRSDAVGLVAKVATVGPGTVARPTAFVEDCAVPVPRLAEFIAGFRKILDDAGLTYAMYGHADVGCVHVRPALDLTDRSGPAMVRAITDQVVSLVASMGGVLWGEHGRGFRGDVASSFLDPETLAIMEAVKAAFDPDDRFNPGKLYRPAGAGPPIVGLDEAPLRADGDRTVPVALRTELADAFACNGNALCHHHGASEVMCPSYKATGDPALSPKGRADLLRAWAVGQDDRPAPDGFERALVDNLDQCLSCSACTGRCPLEVDIPELKSRFLDRYYQTRRRPLAHRVLGRFESLAALGARLGLPSRPLLGPAGRLLGLVDLPSPKRPPAVDLAHPLAEADVALLPDVFSLALDPPVLPRAVEVLTDLGYRVALAPFKPSGKYDHVKGNRRRFARAVEAQERLVRSVVAAGAVPVAIEPAVALLHHHEYPAIRSGYPGAVRHLVELVDERRHQLSPVGHGQPVTLLGHCTERATGPGILEAWERVLSAAGYTVSVPELGCCGMAGIFGHERSNQELSKACWDLSWAPTVEDAAAGGDLMAATGYSCRSQVRRMTGRNMGHPVELITGR